MHRQLEDLKRAPPSTDEPYRLLERQFVEHARAMRAAASDSARRRGRASFGEPSSAGKRVRRRGNQPPLSGKQHRSSAPNTASSAVVRFLVTNHRSDAGATTSGASATRPPRPGRGRRGRTASPSPRRASSASWRRSPTTWPSSSPRSATATPWPSSARGRRPTRRAGRIVREIAVDDSPGERRARIRHRRGRRRRPGRDPRDPRRRRPHGRAGRVRGHRRARRRRGAGPARRRGARPLGPRRPAQGAWSLLCFSPIESSKHRS